MLKSQSIFSHSTVCRLVFHKYLILQLSNAGKIFQKLFLLVPPFAIVITVTVFKVFIVSCFILY